MWECGSVGVWEARGVLLVRLNGTPFPRELAAAPPPSARRRVIKQSYHEGWRRHARASLLTRSWTVQREEERRRRKDPRQQDPQNVQSFANDTITPRCVVCDLADMYIRRGADDASSIPVFGDSRHGKIPRRVSGGILARRWSSCLDSHGVFICHL